MASSGKKSATQLKQEIDEVLRRRPRKAKATPGAAQGSSGILSRAAYERRELEEALTRIDEVRWTPLAARKRACAAFLEAMRDEPEIVAARIGQLLAGNYGYGPMMVAKRGLTGTRINRLTALLQAVGAFEWQAPEDMVAAARKELTARERGLLENAVQVAITSAMSEE